MSHDFRHEQDLRTDDLHGVFTSVQLFRCTNCGETETRYQRPDGSLTVVQNNPVRSENVNPFHELTEA